jgi:histidine triad (HIT) family protein
MKPAEPCIFCKIARDKAPAIKVFEDEYSLAFMDSHPATDGHTLLITKRHYKNLFDIDPAALAALGMATQKLAWAILRALNPDGMRIMQFNGVAAGQSVFHYHVHLRPSYVGQNLHNHGRSAAEFNHLKELATKIRAELVT